MSYQQTDVHVNKPLTDYAIRFLQDDANFIADKVAPKVNSIKLADKYYTYDRAPWRQSDDLRKAGTQSNKGVTANLSTAAFLIEKYSLHDVVPDDVMDEADSPIEPQQDTVADLVEQLMINKEIRCKDEFFVTSSVQNYTSLATASQWGYTSTTTPIDDFDTGNFAIQKEIGKESNQATIGNEVYKVLKNHEDILDRIKYTQKGIITADIIAACMDIDSLLIGKGIYMTTGEGITSESMSYIWGKNMLIQYVSPRPSKKRLTHGSQFVKKGGGASVKSFYDDKADGQYVEPSIYYDFKAVSKLCGYTIFGAVA